MESAPRPRRSPEDPPAESASLLARACSGSESALDQVVFEQSSGAPDLGGLGVCEDTATPPAAPVAPRSDDPCEMPRSFSGLGGFGVQRGSGASFESKGLIDRSDLIPVDRRELAQILNEAFARLIVKGQARWSSRSSFLSGAAKAIRKRRIDYANKVLTSQTPSPRQRRAARKFVAVERALEALEAMRPIQARVAELRLHAAMNICEVAEALELDRRRVDEEWLLAEAWIRARSNEHLAAMP